eukprot:scaffold7881_cov50-Phaeocystis_antarctica.AAC.1
MRIPRPAAEKLGAVRYIRPRWLLFGLVSRATHWRVAAVTTHEHAARAREQSPSGGSAKEEVNDRWDQRLYHTTRASVHRLHLLRSTG